MSGEEAVCSGEHERRRIDPCFGDAISGRDAARCGDAALRRNDLRIFGAFSVPDLAMAFSD